MKFLEFLNEEEEYKIFLDMDGVIVDFMSAVYKLFKLTDFREWEKMGKDKYVEINKTGEKWWSEMNWLSDGKKLWNYLKDYDVTILSAGPRDKTSNAISVQGKRNWISKNIGSSYSSNAIITTAVEKQKHAAKKHILVDDSPRNIRQWRSKGGIGILHKNTNDTIKQLEQLK